MNENKILIHINLPRDILRKASHEDNFHKGVLKFSSHLSGLIDGFKKNNFTPILYFRMHYFFNWRLLYKSRYYKYFFVPYNFLFGFIDNWFLYNKIITKIEKQNINYYFTELNPTITRHFLKKLKVKKVKSIEWFGLFPNQLRFNTRPNKTIKYFDLIVSGEDYRPFFNQKPKKFLLIPQAISIDKIDKIKNYNSKSIDVVFIGSVAKIHSNRWDYLEFLFENYDSIELYGFGINQVPNAYKFKTIFNSGLWGDEYFQKIKQAKIVVNLFQNDYDKLSEGINIRAFEIPACKSLQLCKNVPFIKKYFEEDHDIVLFSDLNELKRKIDFYLNNKTKRDYIAKNGFKKVQKYDYSNQLKSIIKFA